MFRIVVEEFVKDPARELDPALPQGDCDVIERYRQTVDALDLAALAAMVNRKPRKPRVKKGGAQE